MSLSRVRMCHKQMLIQTGHNIRTTKDEKMGTFEYRLMTQRRSEMQFDLDRCLLHTVCHSCIWNVKFYDENVLRIYGYAIARKIIINTYMSLTVRSFAFEHDDRYLIIQSMDNKNSNGRKKYLMPLVVTAGLDSRFFFLFHFYLSCYDITFMFIQFTCFHRFSNFISIQWFDYY